METIPSILDKIYSLPQYSNVNDQLLSVLKLCKKSRTLNKTSGLDIFKLTKNHRQYRKLKSEVDYESYTQGSNSVSKQQYNF